MKSTEFVQKVKNIATRVNTVYACGMFGQPITEKSIKDKAKQYPKWYTEKKQAMLRGLIGKNYFGFDCVCLIKGVMWGFNADPTKTYGGATYASNGVRDLNETQMFNTCSGISTDFSKIEVGEAVWTTGHIGVYIGDGLAVECTPKWANKVQITAVGNIGAKSGYNTRIWKKHGKLPFIDYAPTTVVHPTVPGLKPPMKTKLVQVKTNGGTLNLRETPNGKIITCFKNGTNLELLEKTYLGWWKVKWKDYVGYCSTAWLKEIK